jgi:hypothetical protein
MTKPMEYVLAVEGAHSFCAVGDPRMVAAVVMWPFGVEPTGYLLLRHRLCEPEQLAVYMGGRYDRG